MHKKFCLGSLKGRDQSEDPDIDGMDLREIGLEVLSWIHLAQGRDQWQALMNKVMNLWVP
jgi:hypothetical protein